MSLTPAQREAYARPLNSDVQVWTLELRHSTFPAPIRLADYPRELTLTLEGDAPVDAGQAVTWTALGLRPSPPATDQEPDSVFTMQADGVGGQAQPYLAAANATREPIEASVRQYSVDLRDHSERRLLGVIHLQVRRVQINKATLRIGMGRSNAANRQFPFVNYTAESNPGLV